MYEDITNLIANLVNIVNDSTFEEKIGESAKVMQRFAEILNIALEKYNEQFKFIANSMNEYYLKIAEIDGLSLEDFTKRYQEEYNVCVELGESGWVVSEQLYNVYTSEIYELVKKGEPERVVDYFDGENEYVLRNMLQELSKCYEKIPQFPYFLNSKSSFDQGDYMTSAMYSIALIDLRINSIMRFSEHMSQRRKFSKESFQGRIQEEYEKTKGFFPKILLFIETYPSMFHFLNRLFDDREFTFEKGIEPPYLNRNWLLHGRSSRKIEKYECVQLYNALSAIEFLFSFGNIDVSENAAID